MQESLRDEKKPSHNSHMGRVARKVKEGRRPAPCLDARTRIFTNVHTDERCANVPNVRTDERELRAMNGAAERSKSRAERSTEEGL